MIVLNNPFIEKIEKAKFHGKKPRKVGTNFSNSHWFEDIKRKLEDFSGYLY